MPIYSQQARKDSTIMRIWPGRMGRMTAGHAGEIEKGEALMTHHAIGIAGITKSSRFPMFGKVMTP
jgi:hypothetical protein